MVFLTVYLGGDFSMKRIAEGFKFEEVRFRLKKGRAYLQ